MGYVYGSSKIPKPVLSPPSSPVRSLPTTPSRHRGRQQSTDLTLSEILNRLSSGCACSAPAGCWCPPAVRQRPVCRGAPADVDASRTLNGPGVDHQAQQVARPLLRGAAAVSAPSEQDTWAGQGPSQGLILAPGPVMRGAIQTPLLVFPTSRKLSVTIPKSMQPYVTTSRASEPPPSPARTSPTGRRPSGPLFLRVTMTSTLSTIPLLPPPSAPNFHIRELQQQSARPPSPTKAQIERQGDQPSTTAARRSSVLMLPSTERSVSPHHSAGSKACCCRPS
jgi:hypothetical protein